MIRSVSIVILLLLAAACMAPQPGTGPTPGPGAPPGEMDPDPGPPPIRADHPKLVFTAQGHDFGPREKRVKASHTAVFYNAGRQPLTIRKVNTHCGCAAALLSSKTIPPGGRGTLRVTLDSGTLAGRRVKTVEVFTNDPVEPVARYRISCNVIADATLDPIVLVVRGTRSAGPVSAHFDVIVLRPGVDLEITGVRTSNSDLAAEVVPLPPARKKTGFRVQLEFGEAYGARDFSERVTVFTNSKRDPRLTINVIGSVRQAVLVVPERLYYPRLKPGKPVTRSVFVYRTDGRPLTITEVEDASGLFEIETARVDPSKWEVRVSIVGEAPQHTARGSLVIRTDEPEEPRVMLSFEVPGESE